MDEATDGAGSRASDSNDFPIDAKDALSDRVKGFEGTYGNKGEAGPPCNPIADEGVIE